VFGRWVQFMTSSDGRSSTGLLRPIGRNRESRKERYRELIFLFTLTNALPRNKLPNATEHEHRLTRLHSSGDGGAFCNPLGGGSVHFQVVVCGCFDGG